MNTRTLTHPTLTIDAADLPHDHVGDDTAPMTESGTRYSYALLDDDRQEITWATDADGILAHLIDGYPLEEPDDPAARRQVLHDRVVARARYTYATLVNHAAQAIMAGAPIEICNVLEAAADFVHPDQLPTIADYPAWTHDIPWVWPRSSTPPTIPPVPPRWDVLSSWTPTPPSCCWSPWPAWERSDCCITRAWTRRDM